MNSSTAAVKPESVMPTKPEGYVVPFILEHLLVICRGDCLSGADGERALTPEHRMELIGLSRKIRRFTNGHTHVLTDTDEITRLSADLICGVLGYALESHEVLSGHKFPVADVLHLIRSYQEARTLVIVTGHDYVTTIPFFFGRLFLNTTFKDVKLIDVIRPCEAWHVDCQHLSCVHSNQL